MGSSIYKWAHGQCLFTAFSSPGSFLRNISVSAPSPRWLIKSCQYHFSLFFFFFGRLCQTKSITRQHDFQMPLMTQTIPFLLENECICMASHGLGTISKSCHTVAYLLCRLDDRHKKHITGTTKVNILFVLRLQREYLFTQCLFSCTFWITGLYFKLTKYCGNTAVF